LKKNFAHATRAGSWIIEHSGNASENLEFKQNDGSTTVRSYLAGRNTHEFYTSGFERLRIDSSGRLLIGTTSSTGSHILEVFSGTDNEPIKVESSDAGAYIRFEDNDTTGSTRLGAVDNDFKIDVNSSERLRVDSSGDVKIGGTLPSSPSITLQANGNYEGKGQIRINRTDAVSTIFQGLDNGSITSTIQKDGSVRLKGSVVSSSTNAEEDTLYIGGSLLGDYGGLQAIRPQGTTSLNTKDVFIGGHGNTHTSKIFADGSATFGGTLHVESGSAGSVTANSAADDLIVENSGDTGISILAADGNNTSAVFFGNATDAVGAAIRWNHDSNQMQIGPDKSGAHLRFNSGDGAEAMRLTSDNKLGLATTSPSTRFHLTGTDNNFITLDHATRTGSWIITHSGSNSENLEFQQNNGSTTVRSYLAGRDAHEFHTNGSQRLCIDSSGRVGIGESAPDVRLHVKTSSDDVAKLESTSGGNGPNLILAHTGTSPADDDTIGKLSFSATNDNSQETTFADIKVISTDVSDGSEDAAFTFNTRNNGTFAERVRLTSDGRLGLGSSSPLLDFQVVDYGGFSGNANQLLLNNNTYYDSGDKATKTGFSTRIDLTNQDGSIRFLNTSSSSSANAAITLNERLRLTASGRFGIGATDVNAPLEVRNSSALQIRTSTGTGTYWEFGRDNSTGDFFLADDGLGTVVAVDQITGAVGLGTTSPTFTEGNGLRIERASTATLRLQDTGAHGFEISASSTEAKFRSMNSKPFIFANSSDNELLRITGTGIAFNGDTAGANKLNDYEEGTFTPEYAGATTAGTYTYLSRTGHYTKIGDMVNVTIMLSNISTSTAGTGNINITGLPFTSANNTSFACGSVILDQFNVSGSTRSLAVRNTPNTATLAIHEIRDNIIDSPMSAGDKASDTADIFCTITYRV
jgi:hypothetical protein